MRELSLHILDLIQNSIRAAASVISVTVAISTKADLVTMRIEDNGPGFAVGANVATDPFYTTKSGKKTGLGLSLLRAAARQAQGELSLGKSALGGALVEATMRLTHLDRGPLGDLAASLASVACTCPEIDLRLKLAGDEKELEIGSRQVAAQLAPGERDGLAVARRMADLTRAGMTEVWAGLVI